MQVCTTTHTHPVTRPRTNVCEQALSGTKEHNNSHPSQGSIADLPLHATTHPASSDEGEGQEHATHLVAQLHFLFPGAPLPCTRARDLWLTCHCDRTRQEYMSLSGEANFARALLAAVVKWRTVRGPGAAGALSGGVHTYVRECCTPG